MRASGEACPAPARVGANARDARIRPCLRKATIHGRGWRAALPGDRTFSLIRTVTVGSGVAPDLLTLPGGHAGREAIPISCP